MDFAWIAHRGCARNVNSCVFLGLNTENRQYTCRNQVDKIPFEKVCDGRPDCPDETDEAHCQGIDMEEDSSDSNGSMHVNTETSGREEEEVLGKVEYFYEEEDT